MIWRSLCDKRSLKNRAIDLCIKHVEEIVGAFSEKELQKRNQKEFRVEKVIKRQGNKLYVKWKANIILSIHSWIDKKDIV